MRTLNLVSAPRNAQMIALQPTCSPMAWPLTPGAEQHWVLQPLSKHHPASRLQLSFRASLIIDGSAALVYN